MAYKLIWSPAARDDLHDIVVFIARDNPNRAMSFGYELISDGYATPKHLCCVVRFSIVVPSSYQRSITAKIQTSDKIALVLNGKHVPPAPKWLADQYEYGL